MKVPKRRKATQMTRLLIRKRQETAVDKFKEKLIDADIASIGHYTEFGFMNPRIQCINYTGEKVIGPAFTVRIPPQESKALHLAISMAEPGDIIVIDRCGDTNHAAVGEMIALCASVRKLGAIIVDGPITDVEKILEMDIPVYATGISPLTTKFICDEGEINYDISCGGVPVRSGDIISADENGILVLRDFEAEELLDLAIESQNDESLERDQVINGTTLQQLYVEEYEV